jgi:glycosyltransferase involved in cell wall biosynthesis
MGKYSMSSRDVRQPDRPLSVFQVMPRNMYFGASRATSIDLCVRDLVASSRYRSTTRILAEEIADLFPGFSIEPLPSQARAATFARANHVARAAHRDPPDIIIVQQHLPTAAAIARRLPNAKILLHTHNFQKAYETAGQVVQQLRRAIRKRRYAQLAGIIHVSETCARSFAETWPDVGLPSAVVNNGLDFAAWRPADERVPQILCVGRCAPEKGILEAAQGVAAMLPKYPGWRARFILSDVEIHRSYFERVRAALAACGQQAEIQVQRPFAEVKAAYEQAAIALVPSKWTEPFGRTALEAHAGSAALISSGTGGLAEISGDGALMLPEVTPNAIASAIPMLIADQPLRESLAHQGAAHARTYFGIEMQAARLDAFCATIARQSDSTQLSNCPPAVHFQHDARH